MAAVIRCPACGKPNPDFLDVCQYCDSPLPGAAAGAGQPPATPSAEDDAFTGLRAASSMGAAAEDQAEAVPASELPDWLGRLGTAKENEAAAPSEAQGEQGGVASWLDSLRSTEAPETETRDWYWTGAQAEPEAAAPAAQSDLPDWMRDLGATPAAAEAPQPGTPLAAPAPEAAPADDMPDWMKSLGAAPAEAVPAQPAEELPDWLQPLGTPSAGAAPAQPPAAPQPPAAAAAAAESELPDWLQSFGAPAAPEAPPVQPPTLFAAEPAESGLPDWMQSLGAPAPVEPAAQTAALAPEDAALPDWMQALGAPAPAAPAAPMAPTAPAAALAPEDAALPDWMQSLGAPAAPAPAAQTSAFAPEEGALPDWMQPLGAPAPAQPPSAGPALAVEPTEAQPAWLQDFGAGALAAPAGSGAGATEEALPDWLQSVGAAPAQPAGPALTPAAEEELPDWLQSMGVVAQPAGPALTPATEEELPDWLRPVGATPTEPAQAAPAWRQDFGAAIQTPPAESAPGAAEEAQPEWLRSLEEPAAAQAEAVAPATPAAPESQPEWLRDLSVTTPLAAAATGVPPLEPLADGQPEWLRGLGETTALPDIPMTEGGASPFVGAGTPSGAGAAAAAGELPDWLAGLQPVTPVSAETAAVSEKTPTVRRAPAGLAQVTLPSWLEAMRPVESQRPTVSPEVDDYEETVGVLAGLRGVLRAEAVAGEAGQETTQTLKLVTSEAQTKQAGELTQELAKAAEAHPAARGRFQLAFPLERLAIFLVLLVAIAWPLTFPEARGYFQPVSSWAPSAQNAYNVLDSLPADRPVLVSFDYDPTQAGELNPLAQTMIAHLGRHGIPVVGISTSPAGAALGDALLSQTLVPPTYTYGSNYVNLGYLPGGPVGILELATGLPTGMLQQTATTGIPSLLPADFRNTPDVWTTTFLAHAARLEDYSTILVISATPDTVRAWVEQTQTQSQTQLVAAVSAGAEPLVRPYYESGQLKGLVSGLRGAAQYEKQSGVGGQASGALWDAFSWGLTTTLLLLVAGLFYGLVGILLSQRKK